MSNVSNVIFVYLEDGINKALFLLAKVVLERLFSLTIEMVESKSDAHLVVRKGLGTPEDSGLTYFVEEESGVAKAQLPENVFVSSIGGYIPNLAMCVEHLAKNMSLTFSPLIRRDGDDSCLARMLVVDISRKIHGSALQQLGYVYLVESTRSLQDAKDLLETSPGFDVLLVIYDPSPDTTREAHLLFFEELLDLFLNFKNQGGKLMALIVGHAFDREVLQVHNEAMSVCAELSGSATSLSVVAPPGTDIFSWLEELQRACQIA